MTKLAIVSDSHGALDRLDILFRNLREAGVDKVLHCGDFLVDGVEDLFKKYPTMKFRIARGNCDVNPTLANELNALPNVKMEEVVYFEIEGKAFAASHIEGIAQNRMRGKKIDIFCHGHTHRQKAMKNKGVIRLNPGALVEDGTYYLLDVPSLKMEVRMWSDEL